MGKASGVLLVLAGLGVTAYVALPTSKPSVSGNDDFDFRLTQPALSKTEPTADRSPRAPVPSATAGLPFTPAAPATEGSQTSLSAPAVVTSPRPTIPTFGSRLPRHPRPARSQPIAPLARELQKELRRVGCYDGEIHGAWTTSTKRAMKTFTERVNASLPVEEPDQVLLSLLHGQPDKACGRPCPAGESSAEGGRCVPSPVAASPRKPPQTLPGPSRDATVPAIGLFRPRRRRPRRACPPGPHGPLGPDDDDPRLRSGRRRCASGLPRPAVIGRRLHRADGR